MEHRTDLEELLLAGLPTDERQHVEETMAGNTAKKLDHLRRQDEPEITPE